MDAHQRFVVVSLTISTLLVGILAGGTSSSVCPEDYFACDDYERCIPPDRVCNGVIDCRDKTDEMECESVEQKSDLQAVIKATRFLLSQRNPTSNWDDFTARALVALSFTEKYLPIPKKEKISMLENHKIQLLYLLKEGIEDIPLHTLALHINALYSMCENPRDFQGINLVEILRFQTDKAIGSTGFNKPSALLTLCLARSSRLEDFDLLLKMFDRKVQTTAMKSLLLITMAACNRQVVTYQFKVRAEEFINRLKLDSAKIGAYTLGLIIQAFNAWGYTSPLRNELLILQAESGAFSDLMGTYTSIPALLNTSLSDLQCSRSYKEIPAQSTSLQVFSPDRHMDYSLSIMTGENIGRHTLRITFSGRKSLFELMETAASQNAMFKFTYELDGYEKKVTSLAGMCNDAESGTSWILYKTTADNKLAEDMVESGNIERIFPEDGDHFIFQLE